MIKSLIHIQIYPEHIECVRLTDSKKAVMNVLVCSIVS